MARIEKERTNGNIGIYMGLVAAYIVIISSTISNRNQDSLTIEERSQVTERFKEKSLTNEEKGLVEAARYLSFGGL